MYTKKDYEKRVWEYVRIKGSKQTLLRTRVRMSKIEVQHFIDSLNVNGANIKYKLVND